MIKRQGFFKEMPHGKSDDPSIFKYIQQEENADEEKIVNYLKQGIVLVACGGFVHDMIEPNNGIAGCPDMLTDGTWLWPGDLPYYVKKYHIILEPEFIETMKKNEWVVIGDRKNSLPTPPPI